MKKIIAIFSLIIFVSLAYSNPKNIFINTWKINGTGISSTISFFKSYCVINLNNSINQYDLEVYEDHITIDGFGYYYTIINENKIKLIPGFEDRDYLTIILEKIK